MKPLLLTLLLLSPWATTAQPNNDACQIVCVLIDTINSTIHFDYYHPGEPQNEPQHEYKQYPDSIFTRFDPDTYEEISRPGFQWDSILTQAYLAEMALFKMRAKIYQDLYLIRKMSESDFSPDELKKRAGSLVADVSQFIPIDQDIESLSTCGNYLCKELNPETNSTYKYATKAYLMFSNVLINEAKTLALVGCAYHHRISNGTTGASMLAVLKKTNGVWKVQQFMGISEE